MKRVKFRSARGIAWGELEGGKVYELSGPMGQRTAQVTHASEITLLAPCAAKIVICVGKNYADHVREMGGHELPKEPGLFLKGLNTLANPGDPIPYPKWTSNLHYEGELAVVIGRRMKQVSEDDALSYVLGYTCACDVTARDKQKADLQWTRGKSADGFCPLGPWLETDLDPSALQIQTKVNGEVKQDGNTRDLIFNVPQVLSYISQFMTLDLGDVVLTGTPEGVGPLAVGDEVEVSVEGIGSLRNRVEVSL